MEKKADNGFCLKGRPVIKKCPGFLSEHGLFHTYIKSSSRFHCLSAPGLGPHVQLVVKIASKSKVLVDL